MNQKAIVAFGIVGVILSLLLAIFLIIPWQVAGVFVAASIGIPVLLSRYEGGKPNVSPTAAQKKHEEKEDWQLTPQTVEIKEQKNKTRSSLLIDMTEITKLRIDNSFLDQIYEEARGKAVSIYNDCKLSYFCVQASPFDRLPLVCIYFTFYSKWANRTCEFQYSDLTSDLRHCTPNKAAKMGFKTGIFSELPWKTTPYFLQALTKIYDKIKPLASVEGTYYSIFMSGNERNWYIVFEDGFSGNDYGYSWDGLGFDETNFKEVQ